MTEPTYAPIPRSEQTAVLPYVVAWRCGLCPTSFGTYDLASPADDPRRQECQRKRNEHMSEHRKVKSA